MNAKRLSLPHVILVHVMVLLLVMPPPVVMADMLTSNTLGGAGGGAAAGTPADAGAASANVVNAAAAAAQARAAAQDMLTRNTLALDAVQAMQAAARAAAAGVTNLGANPNFPGTLPDVPDGLGVGGLDFQSAVGANNPTQSMENARTIVEIQQTQQQALLEWNTFNIGSQTTLRFDQSAGGADVSNWIAFNRITDPTGNPSQILGSIEAQGQVYVINQNGIIFGGASDVNTNTLVASALPMNDNLVTRGLLNNPDSQFLFSANPQPAGTKGPTDAYTPPAVPAFGKIGNVTVQAGARITAPTSSANVGGRVALIGPNVTNEGTISTPDGQTILAAGMEVGFDAHSSDDPSLRGLDVFVGSVGTYGGTATNNGLIEAPRGSVVIAGKEVNQNGFINSSTSAALNGRVDLLANYNAIPNTNFNASVPALGGVFLYPSGTSTGIVRTGVGSVIQILPEYASSLALPGTELALKSQLNMQGLGVYLGQGSVVLVPNDDVVLSAGIWDLQLNSNSTLFDFVSAGGQVYVDQGAIIDVAGSTGVSASLLEYIFTVDLRGAEFADSPLQRNSVLRGETVTVDLRRTGVRADGSEWVGTPLADLSGYLGVIERNVGQLTVAGGTVTMTAGDSVVLQEGSVVNVSGGYQDFGAGEVATTRLIKGGNLVDIADADPSVIYDGIYDPSTTVTDPRWGTTTTSQGLFSTNGRAEGAHIFGAAAGEIHLAASAMALDGTLVGHTITGSQQLDLAPARSTLSIEFKEQQTSRAPLILPFFSPTPPSIEFRSGASGLAVAEAFTLTGTGAPVALRQDRRDSVVLSPALMTAQGFGSLYVDNSDGNILLPAGEMLAASVGGSITLFGANIDVLGTISAPAGEVNLTAYNISPFATALLAALSNAVLPPVNVGRGRVTLGSAGVVSTAGLILNNEAEAPLAFRVPTAVQRTDAKGNAEAINASDGGSVSITGYNVELNTGSLVDVSGGLVAEGSMSYGRGGSVALRGGFDPLIDSINGGHLTLDGTLRGLSGSRGGAMSLTAPTIQVGGVATFPNTLLLAAEFFSQGGFSQFTLQGMGSDITPPAGAETFAPGVLISSGTVIRPIVQRLEASTANVNGVNTVFLQTLINPEGYRDAASLTFLAPGFLDFVTEELEVRGHIQMAAGARIETDARGEVVLNGQTVEVLGEILAPAGHVAIIGSDHYPASAGQVLAQAWATVHLGSSSRLSAAGKTVYRFDRFGKRTGSVYDGGRIEVAGNTVADLGAVIDVSGTSAVLDLLATQTGRQQGPLNAVSQLFVDNLYFATQVDSHGGHISLRGGDFLFSQATLLGRQGGATSQGGTLSVESGRFVPSGNPLDDKDLTLRVAQSMSAFSQPVFAMGQPVVGSRLLDSNGADIQGIGYFGADSFAGGGFDSLELHGNVQFSGPVEITARGALKVADGGLLGADDLVRLNAAYVALGRSLGEPTRDEELLNPYRVDVPDVGVLVSVFSPTFGAGRLEVAADFMDVGFLSLQSIGQASLLARQDLRGSGYLDVAGHLSITAGQVYPVTASTFTITAYDYLEGGMARTGSVTFASSGEAPQFPLSGGGRLSVFASTITQGGTLRAPLGSIRLGWNGVGTAPTGLVTSASVPAAQQITLSAGGTTSVSAIDPATGEGVRIPYGLVKDGTNWIDPTGFDITSTGVPDKSVTISANNVTTEAGSDIDIRGGGELYGYRWVDGNGGHTDILASDTSFAILPGFSSIFSPYGPFATSGLFAGNLGGDKGYVNAALGVGDSVYLQGNALVAEGSYTLLPARYALLPGAFLVTPGAGETADPIVKPGGAVATNGYRFNSLNPNVSGAVYQPFEVAPLSVILARAEYVSYTAEAFIPAAQQRLSLPVSLTSGDAGYALLAALQNMQLSGGLTAAGFGTGRGGRVDVSSPLDIVIGAPGAPAQAGKLVLDSSLLSGWNAGSLLIGGVRSFGAESTSISVGTQRMSVDNAGAQLTGSEIILVASESLSFAANAALVQEGATSVADALTLTGDGVLVRAAGLASAKTSRTGVTASLLPTLTIAAGATISGVSVTLDSSNLSTLDPAAVLIGNAINVNSGRISVLLEMPGALQPGSGLVLEGSILTSLQAASALSLLSYSSIDFYGTGAFAAAGSLELHAAEIRGFNHGAGRVGISAPDILLDNSANGTPPGAVAGITGGLDVTAGTITIGRNALALSQYANVTLNAEKTLFLQDAGSLSTQGSLDIVTSYVSAASGATQAVTAAGALTMKRSTVVVAPGQLQLGSQVSFRGSTLVAETDILLPSGLLALESDTGDLSVAGVLDVGGTAQTFFDVIKFTNAGTIRLGARGGSVQIMDTGRINVAAAAAGGNGGTFVVDAPTGSFVTNGSILGAGGTGGVAGTSNIDVGMLPSFQALNDALNAGSFTTERSFRVRDGDVTILGTVDARRFLLGVDQGSIIVQGTINAAGATGGRIDLIAGGSVVINSGASLTVAAQDFDNAGKGGAIWLEAGSYVNGTTNGAAVLDLQSGSLIDLSVASENEGSARLGQFGGTLNLRAPQSAGNTEVLAIRALGSTITGGSSIRVEGYQVYDLTGSGLISSTVQSSVNSNGQLFGGNSAAISTRLLTGRADDLSSILVVMPGAEIVNRTGDLVLGSTTSAAAADWDLSTFRYGVKSAPGILTLRAAGNLQFYNTLSDGFKVPTSLPTGYTQVERMWLATLSTQNTALPTNTQSWSYRMSAGADFSAANFREVTPLADLAVTTGSLLVGKNAGQALPSSPTSGANALLRRAINPTGGTNINTTSNRFQVIRTGTGDIEISAGRDVQLLNQFATIYTAGVSVTDPTQVVTSGDFQLPNVTPVVSRTPDQGTLLGAVQQPYVAQYSLAGGNVSVSAQADIIHLTRSSQGELIADSSRELPNNWLMRRGYVDPNTGEFGSVSVSQTLLRTVTDSAASTTWWVNFSNFFDGVGALGGGNVVLNAGRNVENVSAHAPTNARAAKGVPDPANFLELGGGDVTVRAGGNIDGGIYYVERGQGILDANGSITTNATRSPSLALLGSSPVYDDPSTWLPTTLFVGKSQFSVSARGDLLLGPTANTFLLPQGVNNKHWYKTYFSTYSETSAVSVTSLGGDVTLRTAVTLRDSTSPQSILTAWMDRALRLTGSSAANFQPWLRLIETDVTAFDTYASVMPGTVRVSAFSGDLNVVGGFNLSPSASGTVELLAAGSLSGLNKTGASSVIINGSTNNVFGSATINLSDASPGAIPGIAAPFAFFEFMKGSTSNNVARVTNNAFLNQRNATFAETGSTSGSAGVVQAKQALHASGLLHANDFEPVRIYANGGDISGLELFSGKAAQIIAGRDVTDISFYIQNVRASDTSIVSSGRDLIAYNANSLARVQAVSPGNLPASSETPKSGDIQISGPGSLQVLAGRDLDLGTGSNNADGTGVGITSIGNGRNPFLPFAGADVIVAAGMGGVSAGLGSSQAGFDAWIDALLYPITTPPVGLPDLSPVPEFTFDTRRYLAELAALIQGNGLGGLPSSILVTDSDPSAPILSRPGSGLINIGGPPSDPDAVILPNSVNLRDPALTPAQRDELALTIFNLALRDAGRDHNNPDSPDFGTYRSGYEAIQTLFAAPPIYQRDLITDEIVLDPITMKPVVETPGIELIKAEDRPIAGYLFSGSIKTQARDIRTKSGGDISILTPAGGLELASTLIGETLAPPGIITESGGSISIFADQDVSIGIARIFTLRGGDINIWSTVGDIAAGSSAKTVQSAPPTRVLVDPQSASIVTDLAGLATGGGIGVLATVEGVLPGNIDLIAPIGAVDAGDAGIRATGNLNIAASVVLNAANIAVSGTSAGTPSAPSVAAPSVGGLASAAAAGAATNSSPAAQAAAAQQDESTDPKTTPSIITVEVLGYGGGTGNIDEERARKSQGGE